MNSFSLHRYKNKAGAEGNKSSYQIGRSDFIDRTRPDLPTVLILSAGFGNGHSSAARALRESLLSLDPGLHVVILDLLNILSPAISPGLYATYQLMVNKAGGVYNYFYNRKQRGRDILTSRPFRHLFLPRLLDLTEKLNPGIIISTFPLCACYASYLKTFFLPHLRLVTCITDVVHQREWIHPGVDLYLVANPEIKEQLIRLGVRPSRVCATGIPVGREFLQSSSPVADLRPYRLHPDHRFLLIMGGGGGNLPEDLEFYHWLNELPGVTSLALCGANTRLLKKLKKIENAAGLRCCGFSHDVPALMKKADLLVTRAGGITVFEAIASTLPLIIYNPQMGQELQNSSYVVKRGLGKAAFTLEDLRHWISYCLSDPTALNQFISNLQRERERMQWEQIPLHLLSLLHQTGDNHRQNRRSG